MITLTFSGSDHRVVMALQRRGAQLLAAETRTMESLMIELQARITRKLSGEVLKSHRGAAGLVGSVRKNPTMLVATSIKGSVSAGGGVFWWAVVHEKGGEKTYDIYPGIVTGKSNKKALAFFPGGSEGAGFGRTAMTNLRFALGHRRGELRPKKIEAFSKAGGVVVKHVVHPPLPQRSFLASSLIELQSRITQRVFATAAQVLR